MILWTFLFQYVEGDALVSDSEAEDNPKNKLNLPQDYAGRGNTKASRSAIRLKEIGPRLTLQLLKVRRTLRLINTPRRVFFFVTISHLLQCVRETD
jgi:hypothetical protein